MAILQQAEAATLVAELCREHGLVKAEVGNQPLSVRIVVTHSENKPEGDEVTNETYFP